MADLKTGQFLNNQTGTWEDCKYEVGDSGMVSIHDPDDLLNKVEKVQFKENDGTEHEIRRTRYLEGKKGYTTATFLGPIDSKS